MNEGLIVCRDCALPNRVAELSPGGSARCPRCGALLARRVSNSIDRTLALSLAGLTLFLVANAFPFLAMKMQGLITETTLLTSVWALWEQERFLVAGLVLLTAVAAPLLDLLLLIYLLAPLRLGFHVPGRIGCFRLLHRVQVWSMVEVFMIGVLVALVKLADMAEIVPGIALWAFALLIPVMAAATSSLDHGLIWDRIGRPT